MASERQIEANRRNAGRSKGPRSIAGKQRASRNSYRDGRTARLASNAQLARAAEKLARKIAGTNTNVLALELARTAAHAQFELARIRLIRAALFEQIFPTPDVSPMIACQLAGVQGATTQPDLEYLAEVLRDTLPELRKLARYEARAAARRDRAVCTLTQMCSGRFDNL